jgi:hypothetical protein
MYIYLGGSILKTLKSGKKQPAPFLLGARRIQRKKPRLSMRSGSARKLRAEHLGNGWSDMLVEDLPWMCYLRL